MGSIHPTDFIIYDFNKKRLQFEGLFQRPPDSGDWFFSCFSLAFRKSFPIFAKSCSETSHTSEETDEKGIR